MPQFDNKENMDDEMDVDIVVDDQSLTKKRQIRAGYRQLIYNTDSRRAELVAGESADLLAGLSQANQLFTSVKTAQEASLDSTFLLHAAAMGAEKASQLRMDGGSFELNEYISKIKLALGTLHGDPPRYTGRDDLIRRVKGATVRAPGTSFM